MPQDFDVAIIGFGPAGVVAAGLLGQHGHRVYVCDRTAAVYDKPRALALDHEIMRVFQQLGVIDAIAPWIEPFTPSEFYGVDGRLIRRMTMLPPPHPLGYTPSLVFGQPPVEHALRARVATLPKVTVDLGTTLTGLAQDHDGVTLDLAEADGNGDGARKHVRARYVIGCDGAASTVRGLTGISLEDLGFDEPWLVVDVRINERGKAKLPKTSVQYCEPDRPCTFVIGTDDHRRWEISLHADEDPALAATPQRTWQFLSRWLAPEDGTLWRQASYRFHALVAAEWRRGQVFLAGDAAHQQPPFLGQGMCQGIRDVANLSWKLDTVLRGNAHGAAAEAVLNSYGEERQGHVRALTGRIKEIGAVICERDPAKARARDAKLLAECGGTVRDTPRQDIMPWLETGLISVNKSSGRGTIFPQPTIVTSAGTEPMDQTAGYGWRLAGDGSIALPAAPGLTPLDFGGAFHEQDGVAARWFARHQCRAALIRPDHYVFGTAKNETELAALIREWQARLN